VNNCCSELKTSGGIRIRLATYNVHRFVGRDKIRDIERTGKVLQEIKPDIVALQEVEYFRTPEELKDLFHGEQFNMVLGPTIRSGDEHYGNVLLSRFPVTEKREINLSYPGREARNAVDVDIDCKGEKVRVVATHFGLVPVERRQQAQRLLLEIDKNRNSRDDIILLMGDMNEWFLWGRPLRLIHKYFGYCPSPATYPAKLPLFSLDRIWDHPPGMIESRSVHRTKIAAAASDHLPLVAVIRI
jgi:endonuclease/exonuclease/phosphatase family metal-dependent hydrolase